MESLFNCAARSDTSTTEFWPKAPHGWRKALFWLPIVDGARVRPLDGLGVAMGGRQEEIDRGVGRHD